MGGRLRRAENGGARGRIFGRATSCGRKGRLGIWGHGGWFEAMNGDRILFGANLEEEGMGRTAEDFVRTRVGRSEWWVRRWGAD